MSLIVLEQGFISSVCSDLRVYTINTHCGAPVTINNGLVPGTNTRVSHLGDNHHSHPMPGRTVAAFGKLPQLCTV